MARAHDFPAIPIQSHLHGRSSGCQKNSPDSRSDWVRRNHWARGKPGHDQTPRDSYQKNNALRVQEIRLASLLDTQPECGNHSIPPGIRPDIVVDHHFMREKDKNAPEPDFSDIGGGFGSTSTKLTELVRASGLTPPSEIATALLWSQIRYRKSARLSNPADVAAYLWLFPFVDKLIADVENPQVPLDYFRVFNKAIERGKIYGNAIVADLGTVYTPDLCAELADRLLQVEGIRHAIATGWFEDALFFSIRTRSRKQNAGKILTTIVSAKNYGSAGGHGPMAGARIPIEGRSQRSRTDLRRRLVQANSHCIRSRPSTLQTNGNPLKIREQPFDQSASSSSSKGRKKALQKTANASPKETPKSEAPWPRQRTPNCFIKERRALRIWKRYI